MVGLVFLLLSIVQPQEVTDYWLGPDRSERFGLWFGKNAEVDEEIRERFGESVEAAANGDLDCWVETDEGALALLILLDQFPRNLYRGSDQAFATDEQARRVAWELIDSGRHCHMLPMERLFVYLPLEHSESLSDQIVSVELFRDLGMPGLLDYAIRHYEIIERFGRFPHRNKALGRIDTEEERSFDVSF